MSVEMFLNFRCFSLVRWKFQGGGIQEKSGLDYKKLTSLTIWFVDFSRLKDDHGFKTCKETK